MGPMPPGEGGGGHKMPPSGYFFNTFSANQVTFPKVSIRKLLICTVVCQLLFTSSG